MIIVNAYSITTKNLICHVAYLIAKLFLFVQCCVNTTVDHYFVKDPFYKLAHFAVLRFFKLEYQIDSTVILA